MRQASRVVNNLNPTETTPLFSQEQRKTIMEESRHLLDYVYDQNVPNEYN